MFLNTLTGRPPRALAAYDGRYPHQASSWVALTPLGASRRVAGGLLRSLNG
jgi:hypothetical protein